LLLRRISIPVAMGILGFYHNNSSISKQNYPKEWRN
jgi:hypothetical protein